MAPEIRSHTDNPFPSQSSKHRQARDSFGVDVHVCYRYVSCSLLSCVSLYFRGSFAGVYVWFPYLAVTYIGAYRCSALVHRAHEECRATITVISLTLHALDSNIESLPQLRRQT